MKEVPRTGADSERRAMRELMLLKLKLRQQHPNVIWIYDVKPTGSVFFVVMQVGRCGRV